MNPELQSWITLICVLVALVLWIQRTWKVAKGAVTPEDCEGSCGCGIGSKQPPWRGSMDPRKHQRRPR